MGNISNWPTLQTLWGAPYGSNNGNPTGWQGNGFAGQNVDISNRILSGLSMKAGKQYELDTAQAGELTTTIRNDDAALDPTNTSGPFNGHIAPYQPLSVFASYPPSVNLLSPFQARSGQGWSTGAVPSGMNVWTGTDPAYPNGGTGTIVTQSSAPGNSAFNFAVAANSTSTVYIVAFTNVPVEPGQQYTFSTNIMNTMSSVTGSAQIRFGWYGPSFAFGPASNSYGPSINLTTGTWYNVSATATAPANACGVSVGIAVATSPTAAWNMEVYSSQLQLGGLTSYVDPGTAYPLFSGWVERWPSKWREGGQYGTIAATAVDAMALMSQGQLSDPLTEEIQYNNARFLYRMDDPSTTDTASEAYGRFPAATVGQSGGGVSSFTFGSSITATNTTTGVFTAGGVNPTVATVTPVNNSPGNASGSNATSYLDLGSAGISGPTSTAVTRMIAFRWTGGSYVSTTTYYSLWGATDGANEFAAGLAYTSSTAGQLVFYMALSGTGYTFSGVNPFDGNWHLVTWGVDGSTGNVTVSMDGVTQTSTGGTLMSSFSHDTIGMDLSKPYASTPWQYFWYPFMGNLAYAAEFPSLLSSTAIANIYSAWKNACSGESSAARYSRILRYANFQGPTNIGSGALTTDMGPATDLAGSDALTCLENVVTSENGNHWIASDGTLNFTGRGARYNRSTPVYTFGENVGGGEWPYEDLQLDYDTTHLANDVTVTQNTTSQNFYAINTASQAAYLDRTMTRTINVNSPQECQDAANFLAWRYSQPLTRVSSITLNPAAVSGMWPVCLSIGIGQCIQINRRPPGCPEISLLVWVENRQWTFDDKGNAKLVLQCSPAITVPQGQFTTWRTALYSSAASGQAVITVAPPSFDTVNPLNSYISPGMQLTLDRGTSIVETLTVKSVQSTGSNWTSGTITFTANLAHTHAATSLVYEQYGAGQTSKSQYDANSQFDDVMFTY